MLQYDGAWHGDRCNARTRPSKCRFCKARVFYFSCDCGCKVFFDELGGKWPEHICVQVSRVPENAQAGSVKKLMSHHAQNSSVDGFYAPVSKVVIHKRAISRPLTARQKNRRKIAVQKASEWRVKELTKLQEKQAENIDLEKARELNRANAIKRGWIN